jgi:protein-L-isoaspartate O-methyltransferase
MMYSATYSPDDNKCRLYASSRLDKETYDRVKAAGFRWAPRQELFVAPMWTPDREDLLLELAGEIDDEDKSLVDRAEERAERFDDYSDKRAADADRARKAVDAICEHIPLGQPILVGHHSEKHARRDAEKIQNGMRKAVKMWETSGYWKARAAGALRHAKYKELPGVRARRIKGIEADRRKMDRTKQECDMWLKLWTACGDDTDEQLAAQGVTREQVALKIAGMCWLHLPPKEGDRKDWQHRPTAYDTLTNSYPSLYAPRTIAEIVEYAKRHYPAVIARCDRWIAHYDNRLLYERAMLEEAGASDLLKPKPRRELMPLLNYRATGGTITTENQWNRGNNITYRQVDMTKAEYAAINQDYRGVRLGADRKHRFRTAMVKHELVSVFLTDTKAHPEPTGDAAPAPETRAPRFSGYAASQPSCKDDPRDAEFKALKDSLKTGVQVVVAPQLFPTPDDLALEAVQMADIRDGHHVLEPSAGTGALLRHMNRNGTVRITAVEIQERLTTIVNMADRVHYGDFLECNGELGTFDRIVMNPPFERGADIVHIKHAVTFLKPGGKLVAICANGPRQRFHLKDSGLATEWIDLPAGSFKDQGTMVNAAIVVIDA